MQAHEALKQQQDSNSPNFQTNNNSQEACQNDSNIPMKLEQMVKKFKTHRCALDFDYKFQILQRSVSRRGLIFSTVVPSLQRNVFIITFSLY
jgi:hypothetical protein